MIQKNIKISASIETREVALLVQTSSQFSSNIKIELENKIVNAKSIMGLIALGALDGKDVTIIADGVDEQEAIDGLTKFLCR